MSDELKYINLLNLVKSESPEINRTKIPTRVRFAELLRFNISEYRIPLLTTKFVPFKTIYIELLWFLRGDTNTDFLKSNGVKIWDGNSSREYLDLRGLTSYREGEVGPSYGYQWRSFNGVTDQIKRVIDLIKKDPTDRRMVISSWNPNDIDKMALPPCHITFVIMCTSEGELKGHLTMRSADLFLGVPFNIVSYSLLLHMIAKVTGKKASEFAITMVNCHLYENHIDQVETQIRREVYLPPSISFSDKIEKLANENRLSIDDFDVDDIKVIDYIHHKTLRADMAV